MITLLNTENIVALEVFPNLALQKIKPPTMLTNNVHYSFLQDLRLESTAALESERWSAHLF